MNIFYCVYYNKPTTTIFVQAHFNHELVIDQLAQKELGLYDHIHSHVGLAVHVFTEEEFLFDDDWTKITQTLKIYSEQCGMQTHSE